MILGAECEWVRSLINNPCFRYNVTQLTSATERLSAPRLYLVRVLYICAASFRLDFEGAFASKASRRRRVVRLDRR